MYYAIIENYSGRFWYLTEAESAEQAAMICERDVGSHNSLAEVSRYDLSASDSGYIVYEVTKDAYDQLSPMDGMMEEAVELIEREGIERGVFVIVKEE